MDADIFIPVTLGSKRFHHKHLREINGKSLLKYLIERLQSCKKIRNIVVCTTNSKIDDPLVSFLQKERILVFRGSKSDILYRFLDAAKYFGTEIIIDVEGDKIYTDAKYVDLIVNTLQNSNVDFVTGNDSLGKFDPTFWFHGFVPAGFKVSALAKICELKKTDNTEKIIETAIEKWEKSYKKDLTNFSL